MNGKDKWTPISATRHKAGKFHINGIRRVLVESKQQEQHSEFRIQEETRGDLCLFQ